MQENPPLTRLLQHWQHGGQGSLDALFPLVYQKLLQIAERRLRKESGHDQTIQATELVHEAFLRFNRQKGRHYVDRKHFFAVSARLMRQILVDRARSRHAAKRHGGTAIELDTANLPAAETHPDALDFDRALSKLEQADARKARIVELRVFVGLDFKEIGEALGLSRATLDRDFRAAKAWLHRELNA